MESKPWKVLSIQGHVVSGCQGNNCAVFLLQLLGIEVTTINSTQIAHHPSCGSWKGQSLCDKDISELFEALMSKGIQNNYTHILTGYIASSSCLMYIPKIVAHLRKSNPSLVYVCDPVLGNNGKMYVPESLLHIYKDSIIPLANIITPNQYEAELLTGKPILNAEDAWNSIEILHSMGCDTVVITSTHLGYDDYLMAFASSRKDTDDAQENEQNTSSKMTSTATIKTPLFSASFLGTGDLFTALFLAWMAKSDNDVCTALEKTTATVQAVLKRTLDSEKHEGHKRSQARSTMDLKLVQSKADIENPTVTIRSKSDVDNI